MEEAVEVEAAEDQEIMAVARLEEAAGAVEAAAHQPNPEMPATSPSVRRISY